MVLSKPNKQSEQNRSQKQKFQSLKSTILLPLWLICLNQAET